MSARRTTLRSVLAAEAVSLVASPTWLAATVVVPFLLGPAFRLAHGLSIADAEAHREGWVLLSLVLSAGLGATAAAWESIGRPKSEGEWDSRLVLPIGRRRLRVALLSGTVASALLASASAVGSLAISRFPLAAGDLLLAPVLAAAAGGCAQAVALGGRGLGALFGLVAASAVVLSQPIARDAVRPWLVPGAAAVAAAACAAAIGRKDSPSWAPAAPPSAPAYDPPGHPGPRPVHGAAYLAMVAFLVLAGAPLFPKDPLRQVLVFQLGVILFPALFLATVTNQPYRLAFRAGWPGGGRIFGALLASVCLLLLLKEASRLPPFRVPEDEARKMLDLVEGCSKHGRIAALLALALLPALCEDLAFRGYLLSSLTRGWRPVSAVLGSAVAFGMLHGGVERIFLMFVLGVVYATLVVRWGSVWTGVVAHLAHNALGLLPRLWPELVPVPWLDESARVPPEFLAASALVLGLLLWLPGRLAPPA